MTYDYREYYFEFAEENPNLEGNNNTENNNPSDGTKNTDKNNDKNSAGQQEHMIPKKRFDEVNQKYKDSQKKLDALLAEQETAQKQRAEAEKKAKEEQGKYQELYQTANDELGKTKEGYTQAQARVEVLEGVINNLLQARLEGIPEELHDIIPANLTPEQKLDWLSNAEKKGLFKGYKIDEPVGGKTNPSSGQTTDLNLSPMQLLRAAYGQVNRP